MGGRRKTWRHSARQVRERSFKKSVTSVSNAAGHSEKARSEHELWTQQCGCSSGEVVRQGPNSKEWREKIEDIKYSHLF